VVDEVPDADANQAVPALINLCGLDDLLLKGCWEVPVDHPTGALVLVGSDHKACIMWSETGGEHACTPWPPCWLQLGNTSTSVVKLLHIVASVEGLLFTWVGDLWDWRHHPVWWVANAAVVAVTHGEDATLTPDFAHVLTWSWLFSDLQILIEVDPASATWTLVTQSLLWHEVVGCLDTHAHIGVVGTIWQLNGLPEVRVLWLILEAIEFLDTNCRHVLRAIVGSAVGQRAEASRQEVDDGHPEAWEVVLELCCPLNTNETSASNHDGGVLGSQASDLVVLLQNVTTSSFVETLINVTPFTLGTVGFMHSWEPQRFTNWRERVEVAARTDDAVVEADLVGASASLLAVDWKDFCCVVVAIKGQDFAPDILHTHAALDDRLEGKAEGVEVSRLDIASEDSWSVLEELLSIDNCDVEVLLQITSAEEASELTTNAEDLALLTRSEHHCDVEDEADLDK